MMLRLRLALETAKAVDASNKSGAPPPSWPPALLMFGCEVVVLGTLLTAQSFRLQLL